MTANPVIDVPVLIVGGGPVGMAVGLVLARHGVRSLAVERNPSTTDHPKSRSCTTRTMETFRRWGIEDQVRAGGMPGGADAIWVCESITGRLIGTSRPSRPNVHSPSSKCAAAQDVVEVALDGALAGYPACELRRSTELVSFEQDDDGVTARIRPVDGGEETVVRAKYLVACDGAGSNTRRTLGIQMVGPDVLATLANYYYWADTSHIPLARRGYIFNVAPSDPSIPSARLAPSGPSADRWLWIEPLKSPDQPLYTEEELTRHVRGQWGIPDLPVKLINTMRWRMTAQVAETFRVGRILLAGDAAHRFPPAGGMGLNSGVQDAINVGWKLAYVVRGQAPDSLLDSYTSERRPIAESNNEWSMGNAARLPRVEEIFRSNDEAAIRAALDEFSLHQSSEGQGFGIPYEQGAFVPDGRPTPAHDPTLYWPTDRPGSWFPHQWLDPELQESTIDWFDNKFVLVCGPKADEWLEAGAKVAADDPTMLDVRRLPSMAGPYTFPADAAVLVRPDGIVAWHGKDIKHDHADALRATLRTVLGGGPEEGAA